MHHLSSDKFTPLAKILESGYDKSQSIDTVGADVKKQFKSWMGTTPNAILQGIEDTQNTKKLDLPFTPSINTDIFHITTITSNEYKKLSHSVVYYQYYVSLFGDILIARTDEGICFLGFADDKGVAFNQLRACFDRSELIQQDSMIFHQGIFYFETGFTKPPINLYLKGSPFQLKVWQAVLSIGKGTLKSYQQVADYIGHPRAMRAVGTAVGQNPISLLVPCHRIIKNSGAIGHYGSSRRRKVALLGWEMHEIAQPD